VTSTSFLCYSHWVNCALASVVGTLAWTVKFDSC